MHTTNLYTRTDNIVIRPKRCYNIQQRYLTFVRTKIFIRFGHATFFENNVQRRIPCGGLLPFFLSIIFPQFLAATVFFEKY